MQWDKYTPNMQMGKLIFREGKLLVQRYLVNGAGIGHHAVPIYMEHNCFIFIIL